jgi:hypothetical protein
MSEACQQRIKQILCFRWAARSVREVIAALHGAMVGDL